MIIIRTEYKLWCLGRSISLDDTLLDLADDIEINLTCVEEHIENNNVTNTWCT
jgi:hypothetical protein